MLCFLIAFQEYIWLKEHQWGNKPDNLPLQKMMQDEVYIFLYNQHIRDSKDITQSNSHCKEVELQRPTWKVRTNLFHTIPLRSCNQTTAKLWVRHGEPCMQAFALSAIIEAFDLYKWENQLLVVTPFCRREKLFCLYDCSYCSVFNYFFLID